MLAAPSSHRSEQVGFAMTAHIGFFMDQVAGHITNYRNLRAVADTMVDVRADWWEISYYREQGRLERTRERWFPFVPTYLTGNTRAGVELRRGLRASRYDAILTNAKIAVLFSRQ